ncbi:MAG: cell division protein SepF [Cetobacterium sp.]
MKINKIKNTFRDITDSLGLTFDHDDVQDEQEVNAPLTFEVDQKQENNLNTFNSPTTSVETKIVPEKSEESCQTIFVNPKSFAECRKIADYIKEDKVVTLNLENVNGKDAQRIIDFLSGAINIKEAKWIPISSNVFTSVPKNINFLYDGKNDLKQNTFLDIDHE